MDIIPPDASRRIDVLLKRCLPAMTLVDARDGRELYYHEPPWAASPLWVARRGGALALAYARPDDTKEVILALADSWIAALEAAAIPTGPRPPAYAVRRAEDGAVQETPSTFSADWCGLFFVPLPRSRELLPRGWPEDDRERILELSAQRED